MSRRKENIPAVTICREVGPMSPPDNNFDTGSSLDETHHARSGTAPNGIRPRPDRSPRVCPSRKGTARNSDVSMSISAVPFAVGRQTARMNACWTP